VNTREQLRTSALLWAVSLGGVADLLLRADGRPGLNVLLWAIAGVAVLVMLLRQRAHAPHRETWLLLGGALGAAALLVLRDAEALAAFSLIAAVVLLILAAGRAASAWVQHAMPSDAVLAAVRVGLLCAAGPFGWGRRARQGEADDATQDVGVRHAARTLVRGAAIAAPALLVLSALLMSADPVFERVIHQLVFVDVEPLIEHAVLVAFVAWGTSGYLRALLVADDTLLARVRVPQPALATAEVMVALWLLNLLFIGFMLVQLRYLFGGAEVISMTAGLTYAEYARRGFFELVATATLVVPLLLAADWAAAPSSPRARTALRGTMLVLVVLMVGVIASAAYRMRLYQAAYGLTELRLYVSVGIVVLAAVLAWLAFTVLRGHRERFAWGVVVTAFVSLVAVHLLDPHAMIARVNITRAIAGAEYDGGYLRGLSADAVPTLLSRMDELPHAARCEVAHHLEARWGDERPGGWRTWNASDARARRLVARARVGARCPLPAMEPAT
jgi:hypothetical protein